MEKAAEEEVKDDENFFKNIQNESIVRGSLTLTNNVSIKKSAQQNTKSDFKRQFSTNTVQDSHARSQQKQFEGDLTPSRSKIAIPCLYLPYSQGSSKLLIFFHGNAEDIGLALELLDYVRSLLRVN